MPKQLNLEVSNIEVTQNQTHANKMTWTGIITRLGVPSDAPPCGACGKNLIIDVQAAQDALATIINMPLNCEYGSEFWGCSPEEAMTGHDTRFVIGTITEAKIDGDALVCSGIIWKQNFPDVAYLISNALSSLGFSIELNLMDYTEDENNLTATEFVFTGACTLWKNCAAFESTEFQQLVASRNKNEKDDVDMDKKELQAMLDAMLLSFETKITEVNASVEKKVGDSIAEVKAEVEKTNGQVEALAVGFAETKETIKVMAEPLKPIVPIVAAAVVPADPVVIPPAPTVIAAGQTVIPNADIAGSKKDKKTLLAEAFVNKKNMKDYMEQVVKINADFAKEQK